MKLWCSAPFPHSFLDNICRIDWQNTKNKNKKFNLRNFLWNSCRQSFSQTYQRKIIYYLIYFILNKLPTSWWWSHLCLLPKYISMITVNIYYHSFQTITDRWPRCEFNFHLFFRFLFVQTHKMWLYVRKNIQFLRGRKRKKENLLPTFIKLCSKYWEKNPYKLYVYSI